MFCFWVPPRLLRPRSSLWCVRCCAHCPLQNPSPSALSVNTVFTLCRYTFQCEESVRKRQYGRFSLRRLHFSPLDHHPVSRPTASTRGDEKAVFVLQPLGSQPTTPTPARATIRVGPLGSTASHTHTIVAKIAHPRSFLVRCSIRLHRLSNDYSIRYPTAADRAHWTVQPPLPSSTEASTS